MKIIKEATGSTMTMRIMGRLDTMTAPELEIAVRTSLTNVNELVFDLEELEYISSAGLRVVLNTQKTMNGIGKFIVRNANSDIMEVFEMTGFADILTIEN